MITDPDLKKFAAILLIIILLFNIGGYRFAITLLQKRTANQLEARIDKNAYDESQLIEIRVALNLPYQSRFTDFERHYGEIELNGKSYTYVKKKIDGDVVIFKCIANKSKQELNKVQDNMTLANSNQDMNNPGQQQQTFAKNFWSEYDEQGLFQFLAPVSIINNELSNNQQLIIPRISKPTPDQPPEQAMVIS